MKNTLASLQNQTEAYAKWFRTLQVNGGFRAALQECRMKNLRLIAYDDNTIIGKHKSSMVYVLQLGDPGLPQPERNSITVKELFNKEYFDEDDLGIPKPKKEESNNKNL